MSHLMSHLMSYLMSYLLSHMMSYLLSHVMSHPDHKLFHEREEDAAGEERRSHLHTGDYNMRVIGAGLPFKDTSYV